MTVASLAVSAVAAAVLAAAGALLVRGGPSWLWLVMAAAGLAAAVVCAADWVVVGSSWSAFSTGVWVVGSVGAVCGWWTARRLRPPPARWKD